jgi:N-acetylglucosaminyl-diphospho-decaprenol L-rhamnosyltransferase
MRLSVLIVSHNTRELLSSCLVSLAERLSGVEHEVCVVDNASTDGTADLVRSRFPGVRLISNDVNRGFSAAVNSALAATSGTYVCWLNSDAELLNDGMSALLTFLDEHQDVAIAGPQIVNADLSIQFSRRSFPSYANALFNRSSLLTRWFPRNRYTREYLHTDWDHSQMREVDWVSGACLVHRRALVDTIGRIDERFFMYMEDIDFCFRARQAGFRTVYHPALRVLHHIGGTSRNVPVQRVLVLHRSIRRYYVKHFRRNLLLDAASDAIIWTRCGMMMAGAALRETRRRFRRGAG